MAEEGTGAPAQDLIQPVGFAVLLSREWLIERVSENIGQFLEVEPAQLVGTPLANLLGNEAVHGLRNQLALLREAHSVARLFSCNARRGCFDFALHALGGRILLEGQRTLGAEHGDTIATIRSLIGRLERQRELEPLLEEAMRQLRALTGFDRIAFYDSDGVRLAQSVRSTHSLPDRLNASPAADVRIVADRRSPPVSLYPCSAGLMPPQALLRAPEPELATLLEDVDAVAGYVIPLNVAGQRRGTILAVHGSPRYPNFERQSATGLFVQMLGLLVGLAERRAS